MPVTHSSIAALTGISSRASYAARNLNAETTNSIDNPVQTEPAGEMPTVLILGAAVVLALLLFKN